MNKISKFFVLAITCIVYCVVLPSASFLWAQTEQVEPVVPPLQEKRLDKMIDEAIRPVTETVESIVFYSFKVTDEVSIPFVLVWLIVGALFFTVYLGFINIRCFPLALRMVRGVYTSPEEKGEVSHFQALATALSGTVGLGNIAGVAVAISLGGPGATFWMIVAGLLGMSSKFAECTLGVKYRHIAPDGDVSGGPMYYLRDGLAKYNLPKLGKFLAVFFAIMCIGGSFGGGNMFQANQAMQQVIAITGGENSFFFEAKWVFGIIMAIAVGIVILGGIKSIAQVTERIVPFMCGLYIAASLFIIGGHFSQIPTMFGIIIDGAFSADAVAGGIIGVMIQGFRRAAFSNEAGVGSASIAHSAVKTNEPVTEGIVALLEPFIDTVIICTMTALVIIITNNYTNPQGLEGIDLTSKAFADIIDWFPLVLSVTVVLFAYSTMISWSYYGLKAWTYLFGDSNAAEISYKVIFLIHVVLGASAELGHVIGFSDAMIFAMSFANFTGLFIMAKEIKLDFNTYYNKIKTGQIKRYK